MQVRARAPAGALVGASGGAAAAHADERRPPDNFHAEGAHERPGAVWTKQLSSLISSEAIIPALKAAGKKQALQEISERAAFLTGLSAREIYDALLQRERLGSTGTGEGVAIPHAKLARASGMFALFARAARPIEFESIDNEPVDLIFALIAPETAGADHLKALARLARMLRDPAVKTKLRAAHDRDALYAVLNEETTSHAA